MMAVRVIDAPDSMSAATGGTEPLRFTLRMDVVSVVQPTPEIELMRPVMAAVVSLWSLDRKILSPAAAKPLVEALVTVVRSPAAPVQP